MANSTDTENHDQLENGGIQQAFKVVMANNSSSMTDLENQLEGGTVQFSDTPKVQENEPTCKTRTCKKRKVKVSAS